MKRDANWLADEIPPSVIRGVVQCQSVSQSVYPVDVVSLRCNEVLLIENAYVAIQTIPLDAVNFFFREISSGPQTTGLSDEPGQICR
jgi:hypothetical protein